MKYDLLKNREYKYFFYQLICIFSESSKFFYEVKKMESKSVFGA